MVFLEIYVGEQGTCLQAPTPCHLLRAQDFAGDFVPLVVNGQIQ